MVYTKTSAFTGQNVEEMFHRAIELVYEQKIKAIIEREKSEGAAQTKAETVQLGKPQAQPREKKEGCGC